MADACLYAAHIRLLGKFFLGLIPSHIWIQCRPMQRLSLEEGMPMNEQDRQVVS